MRNAGDRAPDGSSSRRQRAAGPDTSSRSGANGGASLFTPAYRVSHSGQGANTASTGRTDRDADYVSTDRRRDGATEPAAGYSRRDTAAGGSEPARSRGGHDEGSDKLWPAQSDSSAEYGHDLGDGPWPGDSQAWSRQAPPDGTRAVRGFAPAPGDPLPVYPPGPFAAWNRSRADRESSRGRTHTDTFPAIAAATITPDEFDTDYSIPAIKDPVPGTAARSASKSAAAGQQGRERAAQATSKGSAQPPGGKRSGRRSGRGRGKRQPVWQAILGAMAIIAVGAAIVYLTSHGRAPARPKADNSPTPAPSSSAPPAGRWEYIGTRQTDAIPLTIAELYPASFKSGGAAYLRVSHAKGHNCGAALFGSALKTAVKQGHCTQAVRSTYVVHVGRLMGTIGVFNLESATAAGTAATKAGHFNFVAQLKGKAGPASRIGQGTGIEEAVIKGHYLILVWAEHMNLSAPRNQADTAKLDAFMNVLIAKTANVGLSHRMVYGKPALPAG